MGSNSFGTIFQITTWGESHGKAIGVVIDGCPAGLELSEADLIPDLQRRAPGQPFTSPRKERDAPEILSGVFEGKTTGAPISIIIYNQDAKSQAYDQLKEVFRPGHANFTYLAKYGIFDYRGGGRASGRETACRVAAGSVAKKLLLTFGIKVFAELEEGEVPEEGDSVGGVIKFTAEGNCENLGEPVYEKLEANLAKALMSIPATKGFEIGSGFAAAAMKGSEHNDRYAKEGDRIVTLTNYAGGVIAGISNGMPIYGRVAFKPTSSILKPQETLTTKGESTIFSLPTGSRYDPCVAIRAVPVVEAMVALVLIDALLINRCARL